MVQPEADQKQITPPMPPPQQSTVDIKVLLVGNVEPEISHMEEFLQRNIVPSYRVYHCVDALEAVHFLKIKNVDVVLLDFGITDENEAEDIFRMVRHNAQNTPIIIFTGAAEIDIALLIMNEGATDNLTREKYTASPKSLKDAIEIAVIKQKMLAKTDPAPAAPISAKSAAELLQAEEKYISMLQQAHEERSAELKQARNSTEVQKIEEKAANKLKDIYAQKLADLEYHRKVLSWMDGGLPPEITGKTPSTGKQDTV